MRLYIAGPMSGQTDWNYPAFFAAEEALTAMGHTALNPAKNDGPTLESALAAVGSEDAPTHPWEYYLRRDIPFVVSADALVVLPGWQNSRGARLEMHIAQQLNMPVYIIDNGILRPRVTVLGASGYARSGKDTMGQALAAHGYERASFADYIRDGLYQLNPLVQGIERVAPIIDERGWEQAKVVYPEIRGLLQRLGSEVGRNILGENVWVDLTFNNLPDGSKIIVTDCRFPNEAAAIKRNGGEVWRVNRPGTEPVNLHASETALDDWPFDRSFDNNGSLEDLHRKIDSELTRFESGFGN